MAADHMNHGGLLDWNLRYTQHERCFGDEPTPFVREVLSPLPLTGLRLLFPGDGYGRNGLWAAQRGASVVALEGSPVAVEMARTEARQRNLRYTSIPRDLSVLPFPVWGGRRFDMVISAWFRVEGDGVSIQRTWNSWTTEMLRPGGTLIHVGSRAMEPPGSEANLWPAGITWTDHSTSEETRLIGRRPSRD